MAEKQIWAPLATEYFARETQCISRGEDNGRREIPDSREETLSEAESDIIDKVHSAVNIEIKTMIW